MGKYSWSFFGDDEYFIESADSIEECIAQAKKHLDREDSKFIYISTGEKICFTPDVDVCSMLELIAEEAHYLYGDVAEDWCPSDSDSYQISELKELVNSVVREWLEKYNLGLSFYNKKKVKKYPIKETYGEWGQVYKSGLTVTDGFVCSICDCWENSKYSRCPHCGVEMNKKNLY